MGLLIEQPTRDLEYKQFGNKRKNVPNKKLQQPTFTTTIVGDGGNGGSSVSGLTSTDGIIWSNNIASVSSTMIKVAITGMELNIDEISKQLEILKKKYPVSYTLQKIRS